MNIIEKLAKTHCIGTYQNSEDGERFYFRLQDLEAFAKALQQSSEPVAFINVEKRKLEWAKPTSFNTALCGSYPKISLYDLPPASVPLEKYNKLLDALKASNKELHNWDDSLRIASQIVGDSKTVRKPIQKLINENKQLIAEAELSEGKEG